MLETISSNGKMRIRSNARYDYRIEFNRLSSCMILCPFCNFAVRASMWSLCGSGIKCPSCKAKHIKDESYKLIQKEKT
jgi:hypothetical protein